MSEQCCPDCDGNGIHWVADGDCCRCKGTGRVLGDAAPAAPAAPSGSPCTYCHGIRLVGWSGSGPHLCKECSRGEDPFEAITGAWREQRQRVRELEGWNERLHRRLDVCSVVHDHNVKLKNRLSTLHDALALSEVEVCLERSWCRICRTEGRGDRRGRDVHPHAFGCFLAGGIDDAER